MEEKFKYESGDNIINNDQEKQNLEQFYENHVNQLQSYIYAINEYKINHGYLVYWIYKTNNNENADKKYVVIGVKIKKILYNETDKKKLKGLFHEIRDFMKSGNKPFPKEKISIKKCFNCVNYLLCGHKTGKFDNISYPYDTNKFYKLKYKKFIKNREILTFRQRIQIGDVLNIYNDYTTKEYSGQLFLVTSIHNYLFEGIFLTTFGSDENMKIDLNIFNSNWRLFNNKLTGEKSIYIDPNVNDSYYCHKFVDKVGEVVNINKIKLINNCIKFITEIKIDFIKYFENRKLIDPREDFDGNYIVEE